MLQSDFGAIASHNFEVLRLDLRRDQVRFLGNIRVGIRCPVADSCVYKFNVNLQKIYLKIVRINVSPC